MKTGAASRADFTKKYLLHYTAVVLLAGLLAYLPFISGGKSLVHGVDAESQYILFLRYFGIWLRQCLRSLFHGDPVPQMYDFAIGMGDDVNALVRFHPLDFLSALVPASMTEGLYSFLTLLRLYLAGLAFSAYVFFFDRKGSRAAAAGPGNSMKGAAGHSSDMMEGMAGTTYSEAGVLAGALVYIFCGFTLIHCGYHNFFGAALIVLPLMLLGAEKIMAGESGLLFTLSVTLGLVSGYYFQYISSIGLFVYMLLRFPSVYETERVKSFLRLFLKMVLLYLLGVLLSLPVFLPTMARYFSSARTSQVRERINLLYYPDWRRYFAWMLNLISPYRSSGNGTDLNFAVTVIPALCVVFASRKSRAGRTELRGALLFLLALLLLPAGGYVMAAFNNENNRWVYLISFALAYAVAGTAEAFSDLDRRERRVLTGVTVLFDAASAGQILIFGWHKDLVYNIAAAVELTLTTAVLLGLSRRTRLTAEYAGRVSELTGAKTAGGQGGMSGMAVSVSAGGPAVRKDGRVSSRSAAERSAAIVLAITIISTAINGYMTFDADFGDVASQYMDRGSSLAFYENDRRRVLTELDGQDPASSAAGSFGRVDASFMDNGDENSSLYTPFNGISIYNSIINAAAFRTLQEQNSLGLDAIIRIHSLDSRPAAEALAGVRYYLTDSSRDGNVPYGFVPAALPESGGGDNVARTKESDSSDNHADEKAGTADKESELLLYENQYRLPFGYSYDCWISEGDYEKLSPVEKEEVLLHGVLLEDDGDGVLSSDGSGAASSFTQISSLPEQIGTEPAEFYVTPDDEGGIELQDADGSGSSPAGAGITIRVNEKNSSLTVEYDRRAGYDCYLEFRDLTADEPYAEISLKAGSSRTGHVRTDTSVRSPQQVYTIRRTDYLFHLGYSDEDREGSRARLVFRDKGTFALGGVQAVYVPRAGFAASIEKLSGDAMKDAVFSKNRVSGSVDMSSGKIMVFQIPCADGWTLRVDGQKAPLFQANGMYLGAVIPEGRHSIELTYVTPGLLPGLAGFAAGLILLIIAETVRRRRKRNESSGAAVNRMARQEAGII